MASLFQAKIIKNDICWSTVHSIKTWDSIIIVVEVSFIEIALPMQGACFAESAYLQRTKKNCDMNNLQLFFKNEQMLQLFFDVVKWLIYIFSFKESFFKK